MMLLDKVRQSLICRKILQEITLEDVLDAGHHLIDDGDIVDLQYFHHSNLS